VLRVLPLQTKSHQQQEQELHPPSPPHQTKILQLRVLELLLLLLLPVKSHRPPLVPVGQHWIQS
jgi:hypothetical protein